MRSCPIACLVVALVVAACAPVYPTTEERRRLQVEETPEEILPPSLPQLGRLAVVVPREHSGPGWLEQSLHETLGHGGCQVVGHTDCDLVILCRAAEGGFTSRTWSGSPTRATSMWPPEMLIRVPPDWKPRVPAPRWQAVVEVIVDEGWGGDASDTIPPVREIHVRTGVEGISGPSFSERDLEDLWEILDWWAVQYAHGPVMPRRSAGTAPSAPQPQSTW